MDYNFKSHLKNTLFLFISLNHPFFSNILLFVLRHVEEYNTNYLCAENLSFLKEFGEPRWRRR